jgi:HSP20 family protein
MNTLFRLPALPLSQDLEWVLGSPAESLPAWWSAASAGLPALNVWSDADAVHVEAEVPGLKLDQLQVSVTGNQLTLSGERPELLEAGVTQHHRERRVGKFTRVLTLPFEVEAAQVEARLVNGVLSIDLPKAQVARPRQIEIRGAR